MEIGNFKIGCVPDPIDNRDISLGSFMKPQILPRMINWADTRLPVLDQGQTSMCVAYSCASVKSTDYMYIHGVEMSFNPKWLYDECKKIDGMPGGEGTFIRVALQILKKTGFYRAEDEKYYKIESYGMVNTLDSLRQVLAADGPTVIGVAVFLQWMEQGNWGLIKMPEADEKTLGGHAINIVGYDDNEKILIFKNSWGTGWGASGFGYMPYEYFDKYCVNAWSMIDLMDPIVKEHFNTGDIQAAIDDSKQKEAT